jgi:glucose dehydrogenase
MVLLLTLFWQYGVSQLHSYILTQRRDGWLTLGLILPMFMVHRILLSQAALEVAVLPQTVAALAAAALAGCRQVQ